MTHRYVVLHGGTVLTMSGGLPSDAASRALRVPGIDDACGRRATAIAFAEGRILAVGSDADVLPLAGPDSAIVDLAGRTVVPGFHDPHAHPLGEGILASYLSLDGTPDVGAAMRAISTAAARLAPDAWLEARYFDGAWVERRHPTRDELDRAAPDRPVLLHHISGHAAVANSLALALAGITASARDVPGVVELDRDVHGEPTGLVTGSDPYSAFAAALPPLSAEAARSALELVSRRLAADGVTAVSEADLGVVAAPVDEIAAYAGAVIDGVFAQRLALMPGLARLATADEDPPGPDDIRALIPGEARDRIATTTAKLYADGALTVRDAWLRAPYADAPGTAGRPAHGRGELEARVLRAVQAGWNVATHAIGDAAIAAALDAYVAAGAGDTAAATEERHGGRAWRLEHAMVMPADLLSRAHRLGAAVVTQPEFVVAAGDVYADRLGPDRLADLLQYRRLLDAGIPLAFSSDRPVTSGAPLRGIRAALHPVGPSGRPAMPGPRPSAAEAVHAWTAAPAAVELDSESGVLAEGYRADLAVLSADPTLVDADAWAAGQDLPTVAATIVDGRLVSGDLEPMHRDDD